METQAEINQIKKLNELFANCICLQYMGSIKFKQYLKTQGHKKSLIDNYCHEVEKFYNDYTCKIDKELLKNGII